MIRCLMFATLIALAATAGAADWPVVANPAWAGDAGVSVEWRYTAGSPTGPQIGAGGTVAGPLSSDPDQAALVPASVHDGIGNTICLVARAVRGDIRSPEVSDCFSFPLGAPSLFAPR